MNNINNSMKTMSKFRKSVTIIAALLLLSSCAGAYSSKFGCPDASGYGCTSIDIVDQRITSGEIEEVNAERKKRNCKTRRCRLKAEKEMKPNLKDLSPAVIEFIEN